MRGRPQVKFALKKDTGIPSVGVLAGISAKELQSELGAADQLFNLGEVKANTGICSRSCSRAWGSAA